MFSSILLSIQLLSVSTDSIIPSNKAVMQDSLKEDIVIRAVRASENIPITQFNLNKKEIRSIYFGQDIPYVLQSSPSIVTQSDAGNGIGYSYMRMRGIDQTRINFNINGIPVNDPENQGFYSNNLADIMSSAQNIQVQRGVGTTSNGTAPFAGSINVTTNDLRSPAGFALTSGYGSFNSSRVTAEYNSGMLYNKLAFYGRLSSLQTDGFRNNAFADLKTYFISGGYFGEKSILKFNMFGGITRTGLSWLPTDAATLAKDRRFNPLTPQETDEFQQSFYQLQHTYKFNSNWNLSSSVYYVRGVAPRFAVNSPGSSFASANMPNPIFSYSYRDGSNNLITKDSSIYTSNMLVNYLLKQDYFGGMSFLNFKNEKLDVTLGVHASTFKAKHYTESVSSQIYPVGYGPGHVGYSNTGYKNEVSAFIKGTYFVTEKWMLFGDIQLRNTRFSNTAQDQAIFRDTNSVEKMSWTFINPKVGTRFNISTALSLYGSVGMTSREPTRIDLFGGYDYAVQKITQDVVKPESVVDVEIGTDYKTERLKLSANIYFMEFKNEIAATGGYNVFGYALRQNVSSSFRRGIELSALWKIMNKVSLITNAAFSYNRIKEFTQDHAILDSTFANTYTSNTVTYRDVNPVLTPSVIINQGVRFEPTDWLLFELTERYVSKSYLDNTNNESLTTPEYFVEDFKAAVRFGKWFKMGEHSLSFQLNNIRDVAYNPAGTPYNAFVQQGGALTPYASPSYFPAAGRNFFLTLNLKF